MNKQAWQAAERCGVPLPVGPEARKAFADRQEKLIDWGTRIDDCGHFIGGKPWPVHGWYNDEDFCRAYNTAVKLYDENTRLRAALLKQAELMQQEAEDSIGANMPGNAEFFAMCAADCRDAAKEAQPCDNAS